MICSLILGRKGSVGFPGKNLVEIDGKPLSYYPMTAAIQAKEIHKHFISTDDPRLKDLASEIGFEIIDRPAHLATSEALGEHAYQHGYEQICKIVGEKPHLLVLLFCNAPTVSTEQIKQGIRLLQENPAADSAVTVSKYNMFSPTRARRINADGLLEPFIPFENYPDPETINCDRDSQGDVWFADVSLSVIRPQNLENLDHGILPQKWMGRRILPIQNEAGLDLDYRWQLGQAAWWIDQQK